jgi:hypothetical protein
MSRVDALLMFLAAVFGALAFVCIRGCMQLSNEAVDHENVRYLRDVYEQPCMMSDGNCGRYPVGSERSKCFVECINRLHKADIELESAMKAVGR